MCIALSSQSWCAQFRPSAITSRSKLLIESKKRRGRPLAAGFPNLLSSIKVDDIYYSGEPVLQDGVIAHAVDTDTAAGAVFFSATGNDGNLNDGTSSVWQVDFFAAASRPELILYGTAHQFGANTYNEITRDAKVFILQWSDPWGGSANDYDLCLMNADLTAILDWSADEQNGNDDPLEMIRSGSDDDTGNTLVVIRSTGSAPRYLHLLAIGGRLAMATNGSILGHPAAASAISVAAVSVKTANGGAFTGGAANPVKTFSADGPRRVFYTADGTAITPGNLSSTSGTVRQKPDIAAADGVSCATPGFETFYGTSAAAPHAAGIAALLLQRGLTPDQVRPVMMGTALDNEEAGYDRDAGWGILDHSATYRPSRRSRRAVSLHRIRWSALPL